MPTLLVAEHDNRSLKDATAKALTAALAIGGDVHVLVAGKDCGEAAAAAAKLKGIAKVLVADAAPLEHMLAEPMAALIVALAPAYGTILAPATTAGKNFMPRVAALLDVMQVSDITKVIAPDTFERLIYAGNAVQTVRSKDGKKVITVRTSIVDRRAACNHRRDRQGFGTLSTSSSVYWPIPVRNEVIAN
jgi:electron transfer flavoprotein alpha subunit